MTDKKEDMTLDPEDWGDIRAQGHRMLDDMFDYLQNLREKPVWQAPPAAARVHFQSTLPQEPQDLSAVYDEFKQYVLSYGSGNVHPAFMGWVQGGGTPVGMLAEMLAAGMNCNLGGRDHMPIEVERQITLWLSSLFGFPQTATGLFVTGASMANLVGLLVARRDVLGEEAKKTGLGQAGGSLRAYTSAAAHKCIAKAMDAAGLGLDALRIVPMDPKTHRIDIAALGKMIDDDKAAGLRPFLVIGTAGTVDVGAVDDLSALGDLCRSQNIWLHVDGAYGALAALSPVQAPLLAGIEKADSIALDFHKWGQVPYDAGFILVRDGEKHRAAFAAPAAYLRRETRGLAGGAHWPCDYGIDLSRGFRALKTWFTIKTYGAARLGAVVDKTCQLAAALEKRIQEDGRLELSFPANLSIVCFRYRTKDLEDSDDVNRKIVADLQDAGIAAPSTTTLNGRLVIRAAFFNHRSQLRDVEKLVEGVVYFGRQHSGEI